MDSKSIKVLRLLREPKIALTFIFIMSIAGTFVELAINLLNKVGLDMVSQKDIPFDYRWIIFYLLSIIISNVLRYYIKSRSE